ncbi:hypothetical protein TVAG_129020 [Trichomonas vaginalis G3]|uniref:FERM domain-containing protein n=1 Tax=Trichomonas vaginalis (strain ATCC PRA-98 / G3) TaxID=412133 RepID=A2E4F3_TRIV3|nr:Second domain of FERM family [Trichomonas vaginalis G3]EAY12488.1 hypothetical protein TVAG_129020 [Trichomonas vaginalis G3]KAI5539549.1 Second domain of FERM family [Trichomonas vaginalis G3]|eukprot:XP_001324711.1 hypothetical protein [Trichomonas vaginalis G3]
MSLSIYDPDTNVLEDKISFTKILQLSCVEDNLSIVFFISKGVTAKYTFICDMAKEMNEVIDQQINIIKKLMVQRAKRTELLPPIISSKYRVTLPTSRSLLATTDIPEYDYDINYTGELLTSVAEKNIGLEHDDNHIPFVCLAPELYRFVFKDEILALLNISTGMTVFIINKMEDIELTYSNDRVETVTLDMTKTVESLTADAFAKIKFPALTGYSFWKEMDDGTLFPLDVRFTIPEQVGDYKKLKLLRRFFILSGEILVSLDVSMMVMQETIKLISEGKTPTADPTLLELCVLYAYATQCNTPSDIDEIRDFSFLNVLMPPGRQMDDNFMVKLQQQIKMYPPKDKFQAIKKFIGIERGLDMFGYESYPCKFKEIKRGHRNKTLPDFQFTLAPLYFLIGQNKPGIPPVYQIGYRYIINYQILDNTLMINFVADEHRNLMQVKLTFDVTEITKVVMLLDYNIKLLHDLLNQKEMMKRKMLEEEVKMLSGGFVDQRGVIHGPMCDFYFTKDPTKFENLEKEWIDLKYNGKQLAKLLSIWLKQPKEVNYCVLYRTPDKDYQWIDYTRILKSYHPMRASTLILLEKNPTIKVIPIGSKTPQMKEVKIDISSSIGVLLQDLCQMFSIPMIPGLTLAYEKYGNLQYLDISRSISEQANTTEVFYIMLRHFTFSTANMDYETLWFLFLQTRECILRGIYKISSEDMSNLCFFQVAAFTNQTPNMSSIPQNDKEWVPAGQNRPSKSAVESVFNVLMSQYLNLDSYQGAQLYIEYARKIKGFSVIVFNVEADLGFGAEEQPKQKLQIGQENVTICHYDTKKLFLEFPIENILEVHGKINEIEIKYRDENYNAKSYYAFTEEAVNIYYIFIEIMNIRSLNLCNLAEKARQMNKIMDSSNMFKVMTYATLSKSKGEFLEYSKYMSGFDVIQLAITKLDLNPYVEYIMICQVANAFYNFVDLQAPIGVVNPTEKSSLYIFPRISRIPVQNEAGEFEFIPIDLTKPLYEAIPRLAYKFFIKYYVGYAIFKDWEKENKLIK